MTRGQMDAEEKVRLISGTPLLARIEPGGVALLAEGAVRRTFPKGQAVFREGDASESLYVVVEGLVKVSVSSSDGVELALTTLRPPDVFGELPLIDGGPRSASAVALVDTVLLALDRRTLLEVMQRNPMLVDGLLRSVGGLLRRLTEQAGDLVFLDLHGRVAKLLLRLADPEGEHVGEPVTLDLQMTQTDLAEMVGGSRQSVNQILRSFERRGMVELRGREIRIISPPDLARRAGLSGHEGARDRSHS